MIIAPYGFSISPCMDLLHCGEKREREMFHSWTMDVLDKHDKEVPRYDWLFASFCGTWLSYVHRTMINLNDSEDRTIDVSRNQRERERESQHLLINIEQETSLRVLDASESRPVFTFNSMEAKHNSSVFSHRRESSNLWLGLFLYRKSTNNTERETGKASSFAPQRYRFMCTYR